MKKLLFILIALTSFGAFSQTGNLQGNIQDKEYAGNPLPFADVYIKGTTKGATTDFDGNYFIENIDAGVQTVVISFVGYETKEVTVTILDGQTTTLNDELGADAAALKEVIVEGTTAVKESEKALLIEQKKSVEIKEAVGIQQMRKQAVSNVAAATTKISGVTKKDDSGEIYVRGLGDRYLQTTLNGLPIPSDDVERKNIDLNLIPTSVVQNVSISKTYSADFYGDLASGNVDISTRKYSNKNKGITLNGNIGYNTNVLEDGNFENFRQTQNADDSFLGFYTSNTDLRDALLNESWNTVKHNLPINYGLGLSYYGKLRDNISLVFVANHSTRYNFRTGVFKAFNGNAIDDIITDANTYNTTTNTNALLNLGFKFNRHKLDITSLFVNRSTDEVNEFGRNGEGIFFEETEPGDNAFQFVRDQNFKQTTFLVNQLHYKTNFDNDSKLTASFGYNVLEAQEPDRIRNELNLFPNNEVYHATTGAYQQRRSSQTINDTEFNGKVDFEMPIFSNTDESKTIKVKTGLNSRLKKREFESVFEGLRILPSARNIYQVLDPLDNLTADFTQENIDNGTFIIAAPLEASYGAELFSKAGFVSFKYQSEKLDAILGARYENTDLDLPEWDVPNDPDPSDNFLSTNYSNVFPSLLLKYKPVNNISIKLAASNTITLPEFKELAPFEYVSPNGRVSRGNPELIASTNYGADIKFEYFPKSDELISLTAFGKIIEDPINRSITRGSSLIFSYFNTADQATVYGLEAEVRKTFFEIPESFKLSTNVNVTRTWHEQDLIKEDIENGQLEEFRYGDTTKIGLEGASDWIVNGSLTVSNNTEKELSGTFTANYSSDKIFALGGSISNDSFDLLNNYNNEIIEQGFVTLDFVLTKKFSDKLSASLINRNLLNPEIKQVQAIDQTNGESINETVFSYKKGIQVTLNIKYKF